MDKVLPRVTIVTPVYNQADYVEETIKSVLAQDYADVEYIIINDGSSDGSAAILDKYKDVATVVHQDNQGQAEALNTGWKSASGTIVGYLSSDDIIAPDLVSKLVNELLNSDSVVVYPSFNLISSTGNLIRQKQAPEWSYHSMAVDLVCHPGPGALFYKKLFDQLGGWKSELRQVPDFEFWLRCIELGTFKRIDEPLASCRIHEESASFRPVSVNRCHEIVDTVESFYSNKTDSDDLSLAKANASLMASRLGFRSGHFGYGLSMAIEAVRCRPLFIFSPLFYRRVLGGLWLMFLLKAK